MYRAYHDLKTTLVTSAGSLGSTLAQTLIPPLLHDDVWRGFEIVRAPFRNAKTENPVRPEMAIVVRRLPLLSRRIPNTSSLRFP